MLDMQRVSEMMALGAEEQCKCLKLHAKVFAEIEIATRYLLLGSVP